MPKLDRTRPTPGGLSSSQGGPDFGRTRRNAIATVGIFAAILATTFFGLKKAHAGQNDQGQNNNDQGQNGGGGHCFLKGTRIRTTDGEIAVEELEVGDLLCTHSGQPKPIKNVHRWVAKRRGDQEWEPNIAPVKVCQSALDDGIPRRDLYLSPAHSLYLNGFLVQARNLINGQSIVRCSKHQAKEIEYFHIELDCHEVIVAEGIPAEFFLDDTMHPVAPIIGGRRAELKSRVRSTLSPWLDMRTPFDEARDSIEARLAIM